MLRSTTFLIYAVLVVIGSSASGQEKANPQLLTADTTKTTPRGATFMVPAGWSVASEKMAVTLQPPEPDTHIVLVDTDAASAEDAVTQAWRVYKPDMKRPIHASVAIPDRNGWTNGKQILYETSPNERAVVAAIARKAGDKWTVALLDGSEPTFEKRGAQISIVLQSLRPKAYERETFAGRKPLPLTPERVQTLKDFVQTSMQKLGIPGVGLALSTAARLCTKADWASRSLENRRPWMRTRCSWRPRTRKA
jgi:hypothetical protein